MQKQASTQAKRRQRETQAPEMAKHEHKNKGKKKRIENVARREKEKRKKTRWKLALTDGRLYRTPAGKLPFRHANAWACMRAGIPSPLSQQPKTRRWKRLLLRSIFFYWAVEEASSAGSRSRAPDKPPQAHPIPKHPACKYLALQQYRSTAVQ